ncbi:hypothetical protein, variant [Verruconis gallopava]|nr:hypothetical protein, variant [Verruconis gallopava]KIW02062.1 hypothetical protein, variant [Verruconis gallopava]
MSKKEKSRKPIDPPPVLQFFVEEPADPQKLYMNSPNLFCVAHLIRADDDTPYKTHNNEPTLIGNLCSSIHRLKDPEGGEFGYFVFGDISVRVGGSWRLMFTVFDIQPDGGTGAARKLATVATAPFIVHNSKEYKGLRESSLLTRTFSDQGVRLRLRKEPRGNGSKRKAGEATPESDDEEVDKRQRYEDFTEPQTGAYAGPVQPPDTTPLQHQASPSPYSTYQAASLPSTVGYFPHSQSSSQAQSDFMASTFRTASSSMSSNFGAVGSGISTDSFASSPFTGAGGAVGGSDATDASSFGHQIDSGLPLHPISRYQEQLRAHRDVLLNASHFNGSHLNGSPGY